MVGTLAPQPLLTPRLLLALSIYACLLLAWHTQYRKFLEPAGTKHMAIGDLFLIGGGALTLLGHASAQPGSRYIIFTGAIFIGAIQFLVGLVQHLSTPRTPPVIDPFRSATTDFRAIVRAMVAAAENGGRLDATHVKLIQSILRQIYGRIYDDETILEACRAFWGQGEEVTSRLLDVQSQLPLEFRRTIVRASAIVIGSGIALSEGQLEFLLYVSRALRLRDDELADNLANCDRLSAGTPQPETP